MIPQETVDLILDTARIEDVIGDFVTLRPRGASFVACCPFHNEKTPSFYVTPSKGIFKCFGCGKAGSAIGFVMEHEHYSYTEALKYLAQKYHIEVKEREETAEDIMRTQKRESLMLVSDFAQKFYASQLLSGEGKSVGFAYYKSRALEDETISRFGLGWAPSGRTALVDAARKAGFKDEYLVDAGLALRHEDGSLTDKFRERVMFPIHSVAGRVIAFSGRTLKSDNPAKYVNTAETEIYVKSRILYGIYFAKNEISRRNKCILVEGNVDMVMMHQLGITNVVASCGTSLTGEQIRLIRKYTENITIIYDGDNAGIHAALRGINLVLAEGLNVKVVLLPKDEDPDSFARKHTLEEVQNYIQENEKDFIEFKSELLLQQAGSDPIKKADLINDIADSIAQIPDAVKRSVYVDVVAEKFRRDQSILYDRINVTRRKTIFENEPKEEQTLVSVDQLEENKIVAPAEKDLLYFILTHGTDVLDFESDSEFYTGNEEEKFTVADFIRDSLDADGSELINTAYAKTYSEYMMRYDSGESQKDIVTALLNSEDRTVAFVVSQLSMERYRLTIKNFENSLTTTSSWLVNFVPKLLVYYADRKIESQLVSLRNSLASADADMQEGILREIVRFQTLQLKIKERLKKD